MLGRCAHGLLSTPSPIARSSLADGSSVVVFDWDARNLSGVGDSEVDRIVADLPFGHQCRWDVATEFPPVLAEMERVLRPGGTAVLLMQGFRRLEAMLTTESDRGHGTRSSTTSATTASQPACIPAQEHNQHWGLQLKLVARRRVGVGGFSCWALTLKKMN